MVFHNIVAFVWLGLGIWRFIEADTTNMLICFAISSIWVTTIKLHH